MKALIPIHGLGYSLNPVEKLDVKNRRGLYVNRDLIYLIYSSILQDHKASKQIHQYLAGAQSPKTIIHLLVI